MKTVEVNFEGLAGPTHQYAGLAYGNVASVMHAHQISNPKEAALQGLHKMRILMNLGVPQAILPPHERPYIQILRRLGYTGSDNAILESVYRSNFELFKAVYSASNMWVANAATVSPSRDSLDGKVHITPANLMIHFHRSLETQFTYKLFKKIFSSSVFNVHQPLPRHPLFADEGAANHNRFCLQYGDSGIQLFVYGQNRFLNQDLLPTRYPARQTLEASEGIARLHQLDPDKTLFAKQNPLAIDEGVFHNDVIAVANQNVFLYHELAFENTEQVIHQLQSEMPFPLYCIPVSDSELSLKESVASYVFNSQLVTLADQSMVLISPIESQEIASAHAVIKRILADNNPIKRVEFVDCRQSMQNGGGPACLRLRVVLTEAELKACHQGIFLTESLYQALEKWVNQHYRDTLSIEDLRDPKLLEETRTALDALTQLLKLGPIYEFQKS